MRILDSSISMSSAHVYREQREVSEKLRMWVGEERPDFEARRTLPARPSGPVSAPIDKNYLLDIGGMHETPAKKPVTAGRDMGVPVGRVDPENAFKADSKEGIKLAIVVKMLEALTGKKVKIEAIDVAQACEDAGCETPQETAGMKPEATGNRTQQGWGVEYDYHEVYREHERLMFKARGVVVTADGHEIRVDVKLKMSRIFTEKHDISVRAGDAVMKDPLVINYSGSATSLTKTKFAFDLDLDGIKDMISFVEPGSGFLALDRDEDGVINDGSELFGPSTGNGFGELSCYDEDGNQWIDESDSIFTKLRIWSRDSQGVDSLFTLKQKNIGAIYLANIGTQFALKDPANLSQGCVVSSSIYLGEDGAAGTVQQIDMAI